jgi:NAD(P)-dependent dehydrogenase (short-subunit alcohol dehydrogenase family)
MSSSRWTAADLTDQSGKVVVVTGANSGLGKVTATELARVGAHVILACRNVEAGKAAAAEMAGDVEVRALDLADLDSVRVFAGAIDAPLDLVINNAGVMAMPQRATAQGFELQFGTNHLGHFALVGQLLDQLRAASAPRVVVLSSNAHKAGRINLDDLQSEKKYGRWPAYGQSKLANLMYAYEFARRATAAGSPFVVTAAHPGYAATSLQNKTESWQDHLMQVGNALLAQSAEAGAWPTLYAATQDVPSGSYIGPQGFQQLRGYPGPVGSTKASKDEAVAAKLWDISEDLTGVKYSL